jgi:hypothetical protein
MKDFLKEGDVIHLKNGMRVYTQVPEKFVYDNHKMSKKTTSHDVVIGKMLKNDTNVSDDMKSLAKDIVDKFSFRLGHNLSTADALAFIQSKVKLPKSDIFVLDEGEFIVVKTSFEGGGTGMGAHDVYPDGHRVFCKKLKDGKYDDKGIEVNFYQSGCFSAVIEPKQFSVIRTMSKGFL